MKTLISFNFEINIFSLLVFLAGIFSGFALFGLIYLISCLSSLKKKKVKINKQVEHISQESIKELIKKYQQAFKDEKRRRNAIPLDYFKTSLYEMINEIAGKFYPKSKYPLTELSLDELILLNKYILNKVEELFSHKGLTIFKRVKLSTIIRLIETKQTIDNHAVVKTVKRYRIKKIGDFIISIVNVLNPYFWFKKLIVNPSINAIVNKICTICYSIAGEETYRIYSKQVFIEEDSIIKELIQLKDETNKVIDDGLLIETKNNKK